MSEEQKIAFVSGLDKTPYALGADDIKNLRYDDTRYCWSNDRSYVDIQHPDTAAGSGISPLADNVVESIHSHNRHKSSLNVLLYEDAGTSTASLKSLEGNKRYTLATGRPIATGNTPSTQYVTIGKYTFIFKEGCEPLLYYGNGAVRTAFFHGRPNSPGVHPGFGRKAGAFGDAALGDLDRTQTVGGGGNVVFDSGTGIGMAVSPDLTHNVYDGTGTSDYSIATYNSYQYRISYISDTGAESPLSVLSQQCTWSIKGGEKQDANNLVYRFGVHLKNLPKGPPGTMKRRLYRTKNQREGLTGSGSKAYFLTDISDNTTTSFLDLIPDASLGSAQPSRLDSQPFPTNITLGAAFRNHLIVSGSSENPNVLYYSRGSFPEQFPVLNTIDVGGAAGGAITALHASNNVCYVFRERAIEMLVTNESLEYPFRIVPLSSTVGTYSPDSIVDVPGVGTVFLGHDKMFYKLSRAPDGVSSSQVLEPLSGKILELTNRISTNHLARCHGVYSNRDREYWVSCPVDGSPYATLGFVFHTTTKQWSMRKNIPAGCFTYLPEGWVAFGSNSLNSDLPVMDGTAYPIQNMGVMVWCGAEGNGYVSADDGGQVVRAATTGCNDFVYETTWMNLGDPQAIKTVKSITLYTYKQVSGENTLRCGIDYKPLVANNAMALLDTTFKTYNSEKPTGGVYNTATIGGDYNSGDVTTVDKNRLSAKEICLTRINNPFTGYEVAVDTPTRKTAPPRLSKRAQQGTGGCRWFKFRLSGNNPIDIVGFTIEFEVNGVYKQLNFAAGNPSTRDTIQNIMGL
jgi:hypothetical protein